MVTALSERLWQEQVVTLARLCGWRTNHTRRTIGKGGHWTTATSMVGFPDLTLFRPSSDGDGEIIFAELKTQTGKVTAEQEACLAMLRDCGHESFVWRPADLEQIRDRLQAHRNGPHAACGKSVSYSRGCRCLACTLWT